MDKGFTFRLARPEDLNSLLALANKASVGMTSLPADSQLLQQKIEHSLASITTTVEHPGNQYYLFVLEDGESGQLIGTSAIAACVGVELPFYNYRVGRLSRYCKELNIDNEYEILTLVNDYHGCSEVCGLLLDPGFRTRGCGALLSKARFLFMACFPQRVSTITVAEMRGVSDQAGNSPFWNALGQHFFKMTFAQADRLSSMTNKQFIADLMPRHAIYTVLLDECAQQVIGQPHPHTQPAFNMLVKEGFHYRGYIDIFDAGPTLEAVTENIVTLQHSQQVTVAEITDEHLAAEKMMICNQQLESFTVTHGYLTKQADGVLLDSHSAKRLSVSVGDQLRIAPC